MKANWLSLKRDFFSSIVVFLVALPLSMGIAIASGVPPALGLITGIIGGIVVGTLSGSPLQVSGPAAGLTVLVWEAIQEFGILELGIITALSGIFQISASLLRVGQWFRAVSPAVIHGMLAGIGVLICLSQFHVMLDHTPKGSGLNNLLSLPGAIMSGILHGAGTPHTQAAWIGSTAICTLVLWNRFKPSFLKFLPGPLISVVVASMLALILSFNIKFVNIPEKIFQSIRFLSPDTFSDVWNWRLLMIAASFALIASAESLLCASAVDQMHNGPRTNYNRELFAQGIGNTLCGLVGALPMTGVIVRSSANVQAGAKTRASSIFHGLWLLLFSAAVPFMLRYIPTSALAAILVFTGYKLFDISVIRKLNQEGKGELIIYLATMLAIVLVDLLTGVALGIILSAIKTLYSLSNLKIRLTEDTDSKKFTLKLEGAATFFHVPKLASLFEGLPPNSEVTINVEQLSYVDHACLELFASWEKSGGKIFMLSNGLPSGTKPSSLNIENHQLKRA